MRIPLWVKKLWIPWTIVCVMGVFYTSTSLGIGFLGDDWRYLYEIQKTENPFDYLLHPYTTAFAWRPITDLSWILNYLIAGTHAWVYHLANIALFFATAWLLYKTLKEIVDERVAIWTTALFVLLPTHLETILWISGRTDSLALFFFLCSLYFFIRWRTQQRRKKLIVSVVFYFLGLLSKESILLAPLIFAAVDMLFLSTFQQWKLTIKSVLPYFVCVGVFILLRIAIVGAVVSHEATFTEQYSLIPSWSDLAQTIQSFTVIYNQATMQEFLPWFATVWHWMIIPFVLLILIVLALLHTQQKNATTTRTFAFSVLATIFFLAPIFSLTHSITPDLKHIRFLFAPSVGAALFLAVLLRLPLAGWKKWVQQCVLIATILIAFSANIVNVQPWREASAQTDQFITQFQTQHPQLAEATTPTVVYVLHTPSEYRGAYLFHDYYSLRQAVRQATGNPNLTVQTAGTKAVDPSPFCATELTTDVRILSWDGIRFEDKNDLIASWLGPQQKKDVRLKSQTDWQNANLQSRHLQFRFEGDELVLSGFGKKPQIHLTLPERADTSNWKSFAIETDLAAPMQLHWNTTRATGSTFNTIALPQSTHASVPLCAYPNWIVGGAVRDIVLTFPALYEDEIRISALRLD